MKKFIALCLFLASTVCVAQKIPILTSIMPNHTSVGQGVDVVLVGKQFSTGMVLLLPGPDGGVPQATKVINQYKATAHIDGVVIQAKGKLRIYLLNKLGQTDLGENYFYVCDPLVITAVLPDGQVGVHYSAQLTYSGGCQ